MGGGAGGQTTANGARARGLLLLPSVLCSCITRAHLLQLRSKVGVGVGEVFVAQGDHRGGVGSITGSHLVVGRDQHQSAAAVAAAGACKGRRAEATGGWECGGGGGGGGR